MNTKRAQEQIERTNQLAVFLPGLAELPGEAFMLIAGNLDIYVKSLAEFKAVRRHFFGQIKPYARCAASNSFKYFFNGHKYELELNIFIRNDPD